MKQLNSNLYIIENNDKEIRQFHDMGWGGGEDNLNEQGINEICVALKEGKCVALFDGEYTHIIRRK
jgi:hypothetical protein